MVAGVIVWLSSLLFLRLESDPRLMSSSTQLLEQYLELRSTQMPCRRSFGRETSLSTISTTLLRSELTNRRLFLRSWTSLGRLTWFRWVAADSGHRRAPPPGPSLLLAGEGCWLSRATTFLGKTSACAVGSGSWVSVSFPTEWEYYTHGRIMEIKHKMQWYWRIFVHTILVGTISSENAWLAHIVLCI